MNIRSITISFWWSKLSGVGLALSVLFLFGQMGCMKAQSAHSAQDPVIRLRAADSVAVTAKLYKVKDSATWIVLCHQAGYSRGEYEEIAPKLNKLGYNCLAVDLRSGNGVNGIPNETARSAAELGKPTDYISAEQDMLAAIEYARKEEHRPVILFGSSYSASLALKIAAEHPKFVLAVVAFSPGEYFNGALDLHEAIEHMKTPAFVTSARTEEAAVTKLVHGEAAEHCIQFVPHGPGVHGASALWSSNPNNEEYWFALKAFLKNHP